MRAAFSEIIDYAGLFPPATCSMRDAVRQYDVYRRSDERWLLGRFVLPSSRLDEMLDAMHAEGIEIVPSDPWRLSITMGTLVPPELDRIMPFNERWPDRGIVIDSIEYKVRSVGELVGVDDLIPRTFRRYFEVPAAGPYRKLIVAIDRLGGFAKVRTGGSTPEWFPDAYHLADFILAVAAEDVRFKCTAGLHHAFPGVYSLTYDADSARHEMYGFAAILAAVAEVQLGSNGETVESMLRDRERDAYGWDDAGLRWRETHYTWAQLDRAHRLFVGFGSCSFREPVDELGVSVMA
ncbi:MAG TPA: hypothetical protein VGL65_02415 [Gemmatimonadales bacterium]|jgi:hypothetical protein